MTHQSLFGCRDAQIATEAGDYHACDLTAHDGGESNALESERRPIVCSGGCLAPNRACHTVATEPHPTRTFSLGERNRHCRCRSQQRRHSRKDTGESPMQTVLEQRAYLSSDSGWNRTRTDPANSCPRSTRRDRALATTERVKRVFYHAKPQSTYFHQYPGPAKHFHNCTSERDAGPIATQSAKVSEPKDTNTFSI